MEADPRAPYPQRGPGGAPVPVLLVEAWADTFHLPYDADRSLDPGPAWAAPVGVVVGLALIVGTWLAHVAPEKVFVVAWLLLAAALVFLASARGPARSEAVASGAVMAAWMWALGCWILGVRNQGGGAVPSLIAAVLLAGGVTGQLMAARRLQRVTARRQNALRDLAHRGVRTDGRVFDRSRSRVQRAVTVEAADGSGRTWSAEYRSWRGPRPEVGYPVGVWSTSAGEAVVILAPRRRRS